MVAILTLLTALPLGYLVRSRLVAYVATGERIQVSYDGDLDRGTLGGASGGWLIGSVAGPLPRGDTYMLRFAGPDRAEGTLLFYRPV